MATAKKTTATARRAAVARKALAAPAKKAAAPATKPAIAPPPKAVVAKSVAKPVKVEKPKKPKLVRDSFTIPKIEYMVLDDLKQRANQLARPAKKSELLRAGIKALAAMPDGAFIAALQAVPAIKTGRPTKT
jgi:hypothetical protein